MFGGYAYLNASIFRIFGERGPGTTVQDMDDGFFGAQPGIPPYVPAEGDANEERTASMGACFEWVMTTQEIDYTHTSRARMDDLHQQRPDLDTMSNPNSGPMPKTSCSATSASSSWSTSTPPSSATCPWARSERSVKPSAGRPTP